ncbi:MAG: DHH family phosphoesterase [Burkholderiaceae bacterium]|nr:DHH family phosphoesterase [Burkholderiaceae bacterium]
MPVPFAQVAGTTYDVFNGDADGLCALHQLRLTQPVDAVLVTGVKRDIALLERIPSEQPARIAVLDVSLDANVTALRRLLDSGSTIEYFDHHAAQQVFSHPKLRFHWDEAPEVCTSILVDRYLQGRHRIWAAVAAFGDNLEAVGQRLAHELGLTETQVEAIHQLGTLLNYNAYGESVSDLHFAPDALFRVLHAYADPFDFIATAPAHGVLLDGYREDDARMEGLLPQWSQACGAIYVLPNQTWARRVSGIFANRLAAGDRHRAWAVLTEQSDGSYSASVRSGAPDAAPAHRFCGGFASGGGRKLAGGVNRLPAGELERFAADFFQYFNFCKS